MPVAQIHRTLAPAKRVLTVLAASLLASSLALASAGTALGSPAEQRYVDSTIGSDATNDCLDSASPCLTIQHAIDASVDDDVIDIAAGTYDEWPVIDGKDLTLDGAGTTTVIRPSTTAGATTYYTYPTGTFWPGTVIAAIVLVTNSDAATIENLKVNGQDITALPDGAARMAGILYGESGGDIASVTVTTIVTGDYTNRSYGIDLSATGTARTVTVHDSHVTDFSRNGIQAQGASLTADIHDNTITGPGDVHTEGVVPNGILFIDGPAGSATSNTITAMRTSTEDGSRSAGILFYDPLTAGITVQDNDISDVDDGVDLSHEANDVTISDNNLHDNLETGLHLEDGATDNTITGNTIKDNGIAGIRFDGAANPNAGDPPGTGNVAHDNAITGNAAGIINYDSLGGSTYAATCNWWGASNGPSGTGTGDGDSASGGVNFNPWLTSSDLSGACTDITRTVAAPDVSGNEGTTISTTGAFSAGTFAITSDALTGTFVDNGDRTWTWSYLVPDQFAPTDITATAHGTNGSTATDTFTATGVNVAPTATFTAPASVHVDADFTISLDDPQDVAADTLTFAFDCGSGTYATASSTSSATCHSPGSAQTITVRGKIFDEDGGSTPYTQDVDVNEAATSLSPTSWDYGNVVVNGTSANQTFTLTNTGGAPLHVGTVDLAGTHADQFVLATGNDTCSGQTIAAAGSCSVHVTFQPTLTGALSASLRFPSDAASGTVTAALSGTGTSSATGSITISLDARPNNARNFDFSGDLGSFSMDDDPNGALPKTRTFSNLTAGTYDVTQDSPSVWGLVTLTCNAPQGTSTSTRTATIDLTPGEHVTCTFTDSRRLPDAKIATSLDGPYVGNDIYSSSVLGSETSHQAIARGHTRDFYVRLQNDGMNTDSFTVSAALSGSTRFEVRFFVGDTDVTSEILAGTYVAHNVAAGSGESIRVRVGANASTPAGAARNVDVTIASVSAPAATDVVRAHVTRA